MTVTKTWIIQKWGCTLLGMIGVNSFGSIMALRFLLGFFESALVPGLLLGKTRACLLQTGID